MIKKENNHSPEMQNTTDVTLVKGEVEMKNTTYPNIIYTKWVDETQKLNNSCYEEETKVKKECDCPQLKKVNKKGKKYVISKSYNKSQINGANANLKFACDKKDCNKKFRKLEELVKHKKFVHGADKIGYNYSKDFMYVEKNLSFDKSEKNKLNNNSNNNSNNNKIYSPSLEYENNNWNIIVSPDNSVSSESEENVMIGGNLSPTDVKKFSLNEFNVGGISNQNSSSPMNTAYLSPRSINNNSSFIIQPSENSDPTMNNEDQMKIYTQIVKTEEMNQNQVLTSSTNVSQSFADTVVTQSQYIPCEVPAVSVASVSSVQPQQMNSYVSVNNNIQNVNDVTHFMTTIDSPIQNENNYYQNIPVQTQGQTQYMTSDQYNSTATSVQYLPASIDTSTTTSNNYVSYELSSIINPVTNPPLNVYVTSKVASPDHMNYVSSPTAIEYQRMNQPQPQPRTPTSTSFPNNEQQQAMFYNLPTNDQNSNNMNQTYIQHQQQYVQQQQIYQVPHENIQPMVQMQY